MKSVLCSLATSLAVYHFFKMYKRFTISIPIGWGAVWGYERQLLLIHSYFLVSFVTKVAHFSAHVLIHLLLPFISS